MKNKKIQCMVMLLMMVVGCIACTPLPEKNKEELTVKELAYDAFFRGKEKEIYIKEQGEYIPYMVLSKNYYGKTLLLRKYLLEEPRTFNIYERNGAANAYYPNSLMDQFLSNDFYNRFSPVMQQQIIPMEIDITALATIAGDPEIKIEKISRKIFLLSAYEVDAPKSSLVAQEGVALKYFQEARDGKRRMGEYEDGEAMNYWLRTAHVWYDYTICVVTYDDGIVGIAEVDAESGVRPIFCIEGDTKVYQQQLEKIGMGYVIEK